MSSSTDLHTQTGEFFARHWQVPELLGAPPEWKDWLPFLHGSVPNHDKSGCYALFENAKLVYIGLGASKGGGLYPAHGVSRRLLAHVIWSDSEKGGGWCRLRDEWASVTSIQTIGFESGAAYMSAALEGFLIRRLEGLRNARV